MVRMRLIAAVLVFGVVAGAFGGTATDRRKSAEAYEAYKKVVAKTAAMVRDPEVGKLAAKHGLQVLDVTWEDTGRFKGSAVGPNISDMTIQVQQMDPRDEKFALTCMPVIRYPNFSDKTGDVPPDRFFLMVGNEKGKSLTKVSLGEFLVNLRGYLSKPDSWKGKETSLMARQRLLRTYHDKYVLVSAQACFLPIPKEGIAQFNPVIFNYQSVRGDPAVLTILATREGTSVTVIDNQRDAFQAGRTWGQRLFFNQNGERASLTGKRLSDYRGETDPTTGGEPTVEAASEAGLNLVLLIQVPLEQKRRPRRAWSLPGFGGYKTMAEAAPAGGESDVEAAVIGHGKVEGPFTEIDDLEIKRDPKYPIRVTVQFYKATSNGVVSEQDMAEIAEQINRVYKEADYVGSLVVEGETGRPTEHHGPKVEPPGWWGDFWQRHHENTGMTRDETLEMLRKLRGPNWMPRTEKELTEAIKELKK